MKSLIDLPNEITCQILHFLLRGDLKNVRLSSKHLATIVEPTLFNEVAVVPYVECFDEILGWGEHPRLRHHVKHLLYDCRMVRQRFLPGFWGRGDFNSRSIHQPDYDGLHVAMLCRMLNAFPQLTGISTTATCKGGPDELPLFFHSNPDPDEMSREASLISGSVFDWLDWHCNMNLRAVLLAAYALSRKIDFVSMVDSQVGNLFREHGGASLGRDKSVLHPLLSVRHLRADFVDGCCEFDQSAFQDVLRQMTQLEILELRLGDGETQNSGDLPRLFYILPPTSHLPRLKRLDLADFRTFQHDLVAILRQHAPTLRSLAIEDATLFQYAGRDDSEDEDATRIASWVEVLEVLRTEFELHHLRFRGVLRRILHNDYYEDWDCEGLRNGIKLDRRLEQSVLCGGPFPDRHEEPDPRPWEL